jgi:Tfp pilus assembly protein PilF
VQLDLLRLMSLTDALSDRNDFVRYIEAADPRIMSNEVAKVLETGIAKGVFNTGDNYYQEVKRVVDARAAADRSDAPKLAAEGRSGNGNAALNAGDVLYSVGNFAQAEEMYQLAVQKGGVDRERALTRLGIAQVQQNKLDAAKATFAQVSGERAPVARMWNAYIESKA